MAEEEEVAGVKRRKFEEVEEVEDMEKVATMNKRKAEEEEVGPLAKKGRLDKENDDVDNLPASLLSLSDDVILGVLSRLSSWDLVQVSQTCSRLKAIAADRSLALELNYIGHPQHLRAIKRCIKLIHSKTHSLGFEGFLRKGATQIENLSEACFRDIANTAPSLTRLQLHYCYINAEKVAFQHFPRSLKKLSLEGCELFNLPADKSIFKHIDSHMPDLEELDLTRCGWVKNHCLMALCKLDKLRILKLRGCHRIGECFAYTALATRFGFNSVEVFDLRDTNIGDTEVQCFGRKEAVLQLLVGGERGQKITDRGILSLVSTSGAPAFQSKLEKLVMAGTSVTDKSLDLLARHLATLNHLDVSGSEVTEPGKVQFCERRPDCLLKAELLNGEEREPPHEGSDEEVAESAENCDS